MNDTEVDVKEIPIKAPDVKPPAPTLTDVVSVRLDQEVAEDLKKYAEKYNIKPGAAARHILKETLSNLMVDESLDKTG